MIETGLYYPNQAEAHTSGDSHPLYVGARRVSVVVSQNEVILFVGGEILAVAGPQEFSTTSDLYKWARENCTGPVAA